MLCFEVPTITQDPYCLEIVDPVLDSPEIFLSLTVRNPVTL